MGINRLSIGAQSFQAQHLKALGRAHDGKDIINTMVLARQAGFENINIDLMYGLSKQTLSQALADVNALLALQPNHISYYQLTIEPNTFFAKYPPKLVADDLIYQMMVQAKKAFSQAGYEQYEVSAFAKAGKQCRHNINYWLFGDYIGLGAGAHGKITDMTKQSISRSQKNKAPQAYMKNQQAQINIVSDLAFEFMLNALRLNQGFLLRCSDKEPVCLSMILNLVLIKRNNWACLSKTAIPFMRQKTVLIFSMMSKCCFCLKIASKVL